jgi:site-specific recombinase XerC
MIKVPKTIFRQTCATWNRMVACIPGWPPIRVTVPKFRREYALPLSAYPASFGADLAAYLHQLEGSDLFQERKPASPKTIQNYRCALSEIAAALVLSGRAPDSIQGLSDLIDVGAVELALRFLWERNGRRKTQQIYNWASMLVSVAKHWVKVPSEQLLALQALRRQVCPRLKSGMTERNQTRLRVFNDPMQVTRLVGLPHKMVAQVRRVANPSSWDALAVQSAVAIALELVAPVRVKNLATLRLHKHFIRSPNPGRLTHLVIPEWEVKNEVALEFELPPVVVEILDVYLERYRPLLTAERSDFIFPASRKGGAKTPGQLGVQIRDAIRRGTGLTLNVHAFRHLAGFLYLKEHPGEYETVRLLLGHKSLSTTIQFYCGLERADAIRRYDALIDRYRQQWEDQDGR